MFYNDVMNVTHLVISLTGAGRSRIQGHQKDVYVGAGYRKYLCEGKTTCFTLMLQWWSIKLVKFWWK